MNDATSETTLEVLPAEARPRLAAGAVLIDVREPEELKLASVPSAISMPMNTIPPRLGELEALADSHDLLLICHHGVRSLQVAAWLRQQGIENCWSVSGGIDRWSRELDSAVPRY